jgi:hypothetical protein
MIKSSNPSLTKKRQTDSDKESSGEEWVGPKQSEINEDSLESQPAKKPQPVVKKRKSNFCLSLIRNFFKLSFNLFSLIKDEEIEKLYLDNLPNAEYYEKSYMHRDTITHMVVTM